MKKVISLVMVVLMIISILPMSVFAQGLKQPKIAIESADASPGQTFDVKINLEDNPGIVSVKFKVLFDEGLTLVSATNGDVFSTLTYIPPKQLTSGGKITTSCQFAWTGFDINDSDIKNGTVLTLSFELSDEAEIGEKFNISVSSELGDIVDRDLKEYALSTQGKVTAIDYTPGDVNDDGKINMMDIVLLSRYIVDECTYNPDGYAVKINESAAEVNADSKINMLDVVLISRYIADDCKTVPAPDGYGVELLPAGKLCSHTLQATQAKAATCTDEGNIAYWQCSKCNKYFADENGATQISAEDITIAAKGHTEVTVPGKAPTYDEEGLTDGVACSECGKTILGQQPIAPLKKDELFVEYDLLGSHSSDIYLQREINKKLESNGSIHANPSTINTTDNSYSFRSIPSGTIPGYTFLGWYDSPGEDGMRVTSIEQGKKGYMELFAHWKKEVYTVTFDSPDIPFDRVTYTVDTGVGLENPDCFGYTFVGWSNNDGFIVDSIKPGTVGNITLHANWTSNRNKATSYSNYGEPIIVEDDKNGRFIFVYNIGKIENVPLKVIKEPWNSEGTEIDTEYKYTTQITNEDVKGVVNSISDATTKSSGWVLSKEWNEVYAAGEEYDDKQIKSEERTDSEGNVVGGKYFISNSESGASFSSIESGGSTNSSSKVTTDKSFGINKSYDTSTEKYCDAKLGAGAKREGGAEAKFPIKFISMGLSVKNTLTLNGEVSSGRKDNTAYHADSSLSGYVGTVDTEDKSSYYNVASNSSNSWNSTSSFENSYKSSIESSVTTAVANEIAKKTSYNVTNALGGAESETYNLDEETKKTDEYSHLAKYAKGTTDEKKSSFKTKASGNGNYRIVLATTVHVYGVVGYDVATNSFFTYTYNVLSDDRNLFLDFSKDTTTFDDCENGLVTFEVPYEVNEYIMGVTGETEGLVYGSMSTITDFNPSDDFDGTVVVPQYQSAANADGTFSSIKVTQIDPESNPFKGKTNIKKVILPLYVTEIPDGAFEGCTNLETVVAYGVTKIGANAFKGCSSLKKFSVDNHITELGANAFEGVEEISVMAANSKVADAAIGSGAKKITVNISKLNDSYDNKKIVVNKETAYFALVSDGREYTNLQIESSSPETFISNIVFTNNKGTPIKLDSNKVSLGRVTVKEAPGFALVLTADNVKLKLYDNIQLGSTGENAIISKNAELSKLNSKYDGKITASGNYLYCGTLVDNSLLNFTTGGKKLITEEEYLNYLTSNIVTFNPNNGTIADLEATKTVFYGQLYGELPIPTREHYSFLGWFTEATGGTEITCESIVEALNNQTLYAHWSRNTYKVNFNANSGSVSTASKNVESGATYGELPTPTRTGWKFLGWYTATSGGTKISSDTTVTINAEQTLYARWEPIAYSVSWSNVSNCNITVKRTSSPNKGAATGNLSNGAAVYYGDVLSVTYTAATGYSISSKGITSITVTRNITNNDIKVTVTPKDCTYTIKYISTNGTDLGSSSITKKFGTTNTVSAPGKTGYVTPSAQTVKWDALSKTITFKYSPNGVTTEQLLASGPWSNGFASGTGPSYLAYAQYQNRTATTVQVRIRWVQKIYKAWYGNNQYFSSTIGGVGTGTVHIVAASTWNSYIANDSRTVYSGWVTVPVSATSTSVSISTKMWAEDWSGSWSANMAIPTY